jgi:hypothetical protein
MNLLAPNLRTHSKASMTAGPRRLRDPGMKSFGVTEDSLGFGAYNWDRDVIEHHPRHGGDMILGVIPCFKSDLTVAFLFARGRPVG